jgi:hypothetical protein
MRAVMLLIALAVLASCAKDPAKEAAPPPQADEHAEAAAEAPKPPSPARASDDAEEAQLVTAPAEGSPEAVIRGLLTASMNPDVTAGWEATQALLHSSMHTQRALKSYREMNYPASRRKVALFTPDDTKPHFRVARTAKPADDRIKLFIHNERSMPTPCTLRKDPEANGAWRVHVCSL